MSTFSAAANLQLLTSPAAYRLKRTGTTNDAVFYGLKSPTSILQCNLPRPAASSFSPNTKPSKFPLSVLNSVASPETLSVAAASCTLFGFPKYGGGGGGGSGGGGGGSGNGGGEGGGFWNFLSAAAIAKDDDPQQDWDSHGLPANIVVQLNKLSGFKKYKVSEILFLDRLRRSSVDTEPFFEMVSIRPGGVYTKAQLQKELETLSTMELFEKVEMEMKTNPDGTINVTMPVVEATWPAADRFRCINVGLMPQPKAIEMDADMTEKEKIEFLNSQKEDYYRRIDRARPCLLPTSVQREIVGMMRDQGKLSSRLLQRIRHRVEQWYHKKGYTLARVVNYGNFGNKEVVFEVVEGDITRVVVQFQDKLGNVCEGNTQFALIQRELPKQLRRGNLFNIAAARQALSNLSSLGLFTNMEINPHYDENDGGVILHFKLHEQEQKSAEVSTEWSIVPGRGGRPSLASVVPGGTVSFEHRNIKGLNRSLLCTMTTSSFVNPQDDLAFKVEYTHPYVDGVSNPRNRTFRTSCFNSRKLSPVFTGGPGIEEVPPIWVDRAGLKANVTENFTKQSKFTYGLVMEEITTRDEGSHVSANGQRVLPSGGISADGPPTTLSGTGVDRMAFLQANITRDSTRYVNGSIVGERNMFQVDQGLGIGNKFPFFNRHQLTLTRFLQLKNAEEGAGNPPPPVLVLHGRYGGCVGDLPSYDAFTLGGPFSVRGYNMGELGAARYILELATELRIPVKNIQAFVFAEHGNDLGTSKAVKGNPTGVYRRRGQGSSYGVGAKLGSMRVEYAVDHNSGTGALFFRCGERF